MTIRREILSLSLAAAAMCAASPASAQRVALEFRGSLPRATGDFQDPGGMQASGDAGFGADLIVNLSPHMSLYGGWSRNAFDCAGCEGGDQIVSRGFEGGLKFILAPEARVLPWIRGGVALHKTHVDRRSLDATSNAGAGVQLSAGVDVPLGRTLSFSPALRYQQYEAEFPVLGDYLVTRENVSFVTLDLGLHIHMGR